MAREPPRLLGDTVTPSMAVASVARETRVAIPTKNEKLRTLPVDRIRAYLTAFLQYVRAHPTRR
jgi:hypothetical protein